MVRIVVLNYQGGAMTLRCLTHLEALQWPAERLELVLIDNASTDGVVDRVRAEHPRVRVIETGANLGFPANNLAMGGRDDLDGIDYVALVNNDAFVEPGWLEPLVDALEADPGLGAASSKLLFAPTFRSVHLASPTFRPPGDKRALGVQLLGVRVDGEDRWADVHAVGGFHPRETSPDGPFHWSGATGEIQIPLSSGAEGAPTDAPAVEVLLRSPSGPVEVTAGPGSEAAVRITVGPEPRWASVPLTGGRYDLVNNAGSFVTTTGFGGDRGYQALDDATFDEPTEVFAWCGASVLLRAAYLDDVGGFAERFFLYYEDIDLSWRGQARGWRYCYVPESRARHVHSASSVEGSALFDHYVERNRLLMLTRNAPAGLVARQVLRHLTATASYARRDVFSALLHRRRPAPATLRRRLRAELAFLRLLPWALRTRRQLRRRQVRPDAELLRGLTAP